MIDGYEIRKRVERGRQAKADGAFFEKMIEDACFRYKLNRIAYIEKTPEPLRPIKKIEGKKFVAVYEDKAQPDFKGTIAGGRAICFEAKATNDTKIQCSRLQPQQIEALKIHSNLGAEVFILVMFLSINQCYKVPLKFWMDAYKNFGRQYFKYQDLDEFKIPTEGMKIDFITDRVKTFEEFKKDTKGVIWSTKVKLAQRV